MPAILSTTTNLISNSNDKQMFDESIYKTSDRVPNFRINYFNCDLKSSNVNKGFLKYESIISKLGDIYLNSCLNLCVCIQQKQLVLAPLAPDN